MRAYWVRHIWSRLPKRFRKAYYNWRRIPHYDGIPIYITDNLVADSVDNESILG